MAIIVAVDPGSHFAGVSVWDTELPESQALLAVHPLVANDAPSPVRVWQLFSAITHIAYEHLWEAKPGNVLVAEHLKGRGVQPAPELDVICRGLQQWSETWGFKYVEYKPLQWHRAVMVSGMLPGDKGAIVWAMTARFPQLKGLVNQPGGEDAIEAAAIGLHHWSQMRLLPGGR